MNTNHRSQNDRSSHRAGATHTNRRPAPRAHAPRRRGPTAPARSRDRGGIHPSRYVRKATAQTIVEHVSAYKFADLPLSPALHARIQKRGYATPTHIQEVAIPHVLLGRDVVGIANTGTGKTGAFLIPLIEKVTAQKGESVLIMAPTRELAIQIHTELRALTDGMRLYSVVCVGGTGIGPQLKSLRFHNEFIIGTPGRLKDLVQRGALDLSRVSSVVLDEADRMLDMGFIADMRFLIGRMPAKKQTLFFSATLSRDVERVIGEFLSDPVRVSVTTGETADRVDQDVVHIGRDESKVEVLCRLLAEQELHKVIVFGRTKHGVEKLSKTLVERGIRAVSIHGNKRHNERQRALQAFRTDATRVLVATDVAARGLDIPAVSHVINFDQPTTYEDYVHRIGRTGRAGRTGIALTFVEGAPHR